MFPRRRSLRAPVDKSAVETPEKVVSVCVCDTPDAVLRRRLDARGRYGSGELPPPELRLLPPARSLFWSGKRDIRGVGLQVTCTSSG